MHNAALAAGYDAGDIERFRSAFHDSQLTTIDSFLNFHPAFRGIGKFAIAHELISVEDEQALLQRGRKSWYRQFRLGLGHGHEHLRQQNIGIITFNYDRSLQHFLYKAYHSVSKSSSGPEEVPLLMSKLGFAHVHGKLSPLPWQNPNGRPYGSPNKPEMYTQAAQGILIADEECTVTYDGVPLTQVIAEADNIVFLGFGYDPSNLKKLGLDQAQRRIRFFGSGVGLSPTRQMELRTAFRFKAGKSIPAVLNDIGIPYIGGNEPDFGGQLGDDAI